MKKLREFDDMDWIRNISSNLNGSAIVFEPMVDETAWPKIVNLLGNHHFGSSKILLVKDFNLFVDNIKLLHHLVIEEDGGVIYGGMYENAYYDLIDNGYSEEEIRNDWEEERDAMNNFFTRTFSKGFKPTIHDGYELLGLSRQINESDEMDWIRDVKVSYLNKAFYFDPPAEQGDSDYEELVRLFKGEGYEPAYGTPDTPDGGEVIGLYCYLDITDGTPSYVFTSVDYDTRESIEDYYVHIRDFAREESVDRGEDIEIIDARQFLHGGNYLNESDELGWIRDVEPQIKPGAKFKCVTSGIILTVTEIDGKWIIYDLFKADGSVITKRGGLPFNLLQNYVDGGSWTPVP